MEYDCTLFKQQVNTNAWMEYHRPTCFTTTKTSFIIKDRETSSLIADFPFTTIQKCEFHRSIKLCRIWVQKNDNNSEYVSYGIQIDSELDYDILFEALKSKSIEGTESKINDYTKKMSDTIFPDLIDPDVQDNVISILFDGEFNQFVKSVSKMMEHLDDMNSSLEL